MTTTDPIITLYWLNQSRSQRVLWLLEELGVPYTLETAQRSPDKMAPVAAKDIHPLGKYPMVVIDGRVLAESGLIVETLIERFAPDTLQPPRADVDEYLRYRYFMHYAEGSFMPPMLVAVIVKGIREAPVPFFVKPLLNMVAAKVPPPLPNPLRGREGVCADRGGKQVEESYLQPQFETHLGFLEDELKDRDYMAGGKLTGADIMMSFPLVAADGRISGYTRDRYPSIFAYIDRLKTREAYVKAKKVVSSSFLLGRIQANRCRRKIWKVGLCR